MTPWANELHVTPAGDREWRLLQPFTYQGPRGTITVPAGFVTDFASVPRILWALCPPFGKYTAAAVIHDYLYRERAGTRSDADRTFLEIMIQDRTRVVRAFLMWAAVRLFGWRFWRR